MGEVLRGGRSCVGTVSGGAVANARVGENNGAKEADGVDGVHRCHGAGTMLTRDTCRQGARPTWPRRASAATVSNEC